MNEFLKTRRQISEATEWLTDNNYFTHPISAKDWELFLITRNIKDGDLLDMGADGSRVLHNAAVKNIMGKKMGIDLVEVTGDNKSQWAEYVQGDLMATPFDDNSFDTLISQSVIEHDVDLSSFARECSRLLRKGGKLIVSFDYWPQLINTEGLKLYGLDWHILNQADVLYLVEVMQFAGLNINGHINWETQDAVINPTYCSPFPDISYTFGIFEFIKQ